MVVTLATITTLLLGLHFRRSSQRGTALLIFSIFVTYCITAKIEIKNNFIQGVDKQNKTM